MRSSIAAEPLLSNTGAGLAPALACDWRIGAPTARILFREGPVGLVPTHGGVTRLVKLLGLARAKELLLGGDDLGAEAGLCAGLLSELAADVDQRSGLVAESLAQTALLQTEDHREGLAAVRERREPDFKGT